MIQLLKTTLEFCVAHTRARIQFCSTNPFVFLIKLKLKNLLGYYNKKLPQLLAPSWGPD